MTIYQKLNNARKQFHQLRLKKTGWNKYSEYWYFELADFLIPAIGIFEANELCAVVSFETEIASMRIADVVSGEVITITSPMGSAKLKACHEVQNIGAVETYQRRYLWIAALEIVEHDALDAVTGKDAPKQGQPLSGVWEACSPELQAELTEVAGICGEWFENGDIKGLVDYLNGKGYDADTKSALWTRLDSKIRAAVKKETTERKAK